MSENVRRLAEALTKRLADEGKLVERGWQIYRLFMLKRGFHEAADVEEEAFMAGCEFMFTSMINMLDPGTEETDADMRRMDLLHDGVQQIQARLQLKYGRTAGSA